MPRPHGEVPEDDTVVGMIIDLKDARKRSEMTCKQVAEQLGVSRQAVENWEAFRTHPNVHHMARWARLFNRDIGLGF